MKFTGFVASLALAGMVSAAALPTVPGLNGAVEGTEGAVKATLAGLTHGAKRQLDALYPATNAVGSSLNGVTGITGSAVGTVGSTVGGGVGTAESALSNPAGGI